MSVAVDRVEVPSGRFSSIVTALNTKYHRAAMWLFMGIVIAHWVEHILQAIQIYGLGWERPAARGALGLAFPWLATSETLHYGYAIIMLVGLLLFAPGNVGTARKWWFIALAIQFWHHFEHALLLGQASSGTNLFGSDVPTSIAQLVIPRVELHLLYNALVFVPMVIAMYYHVRPPEEDRKLMLCSCASYAHSH